MPETALLSKTIRTLAGALAALPLLLSSAAHAEKQKLATYDSLMLSVMDGRCALESVTPGPLMLIFSGDGGNRLVIASQDEAWPQIGRDAKITWNFGAEGKSLDLSGGSSVDHGFSVALEDEEAALFLDSFAINSEIFMRVNEAPFANFSYPGAGDAVRAFRQCHEDMTSETL